MIAENIINTSITPLKPTDTVDRAIQWMEELKVSHLPIVEDFKFLGLANEVYLLDQTNLPLVETGLEFRKVACKSSDHIFDVISILNQYKVSTIAVLDEKENYIGSIRTQDLFNWISTQSAFQQSGGIIVLVTHQHNYSLSEISQIVESNDTKILYTSIVNDNIDPTKIKLFLKLNKEDLTRVVDAFERYEYTIVATFSQGDIRNETQDRLDNLIKYINI